MHNFCIDFENKKIVQISDGKPDSFLDDLKDIEKIDVEKAEEKCRTIKILLKGKELPVIIVINEDNQMVKYENPYLQQVGDNFLANNTSLEELNLPQLQRAGNNFFMQNKVLEKVNLPELQEVGDYFLGYNQKLTRLYLPKSYSELEITFCLKMKY